MIGERGVALVYSRIVEMGYLWYPSGGVEAGIDGRMEVRNEDGEVTNLIVSVQSKATDGDFEGETDIHRCAELSYKQAEEAVFCTRGGVCRFSRRIRDCTCLALCLSK